MSLRGLWQWRANSTTDCAHYLGLCHNGKESSRFMQVVVHIAKSNPRHTPVTSEWGSEHWAGIYSALRLWWVCTFRHSRYTAGGVSSRHDWIGSDRNILDPLLVIAHVSACMYLLRFTPLPSTANVKIIIWSCRTPDMSRVWVWEMKWNATCPRTLNAKRILKKEINLCLIVSRDRKCAEF